MIWRYLTPVNSSKIPTEQLKTNIIQLLEEKKKRKFNETVELQIGLRDYDPDRDKRFTGAIRLPSMPYPNKKVHLLAYEPGYMKSNYDNRLLLSVLLLTAIKLRRSAFLALMSMVSRSSTRIRSSSRSGPSHISSLSPPSL